MPSESPPRRERPDLRRAALAPPVSVRECSPDEGRELVRVARDAMVTRSRDLDAFAYADPRDARLVDCGDGLAFAVLGVQPDRRLFLEAVYAFLTLRNQVPVGYVLVSALFGSSEIAFNVFDTFRGAEAAWTYGRVLATTRALFGSDSFTVFPYQLGGEGNDEGLRSGAWWFYQKLGFRARDPGVLRIMQSELRRLRADPRLRTPRRTLERLAAHPVHLDLGRRREDVIGVFPIETAGFAVMRELARRGADRAAGEAACLREAAALLGVRRTVGWSFGEKLWLARWAPLVLALPGISRWPAADRVGLLEVIRAKGGRREGEFAFRLARHRRLRTALRRLARREG